MKRWDYSWPRGKHARQAVRELGMVSRRDTKQGRLPLNGGWIAWYDTALAVAADGNGDLSLPPVAPTHTQARAPGTYLHARMERACTCICRSLQQTLYPYVRIFKTIDVDRRRGWGFPSQHGGSQPREVTTWPCSRITTRHQGRLLVDRCVPALSSVNCFVSALRPVWLSRHNRFGCIYPMHVHVAVGPPLSLVCRLSSCRSHLFKLFGICNYYFSLIGTITLRMHACTLYTYKHLREIESTNFEIDKITVTTW